MGFPLRFGGRKEKKKWHNHNFKKNIFFQKATMDRRDTREEKGYGRNGGGKDQ